MQASAVSPHLLVSRAFYMLRVIRSRIFTSLQTAVKYLDIPESCFSTLVSRETLSANLIDFVLEGRENIPIWQKLTWFVCSYCGSHQIKMILILLCFLGEWSATLQGEWPRTSSPPGPAWKPHLSRLPSPRFSSTEEWGSEITTNLLTRRDGLRHFLVD